MSDPTWGAQETKTFADFEQQPSSDVRAEPQTGVGHPEHLPSLLDKLRPHFALAFSRQAQEEIDWEVSMMFYPNPQDHSMQAVVAVYAQTPGAVLGTTVSMCTMAQPTMDMEQNVDGWVRNTLESLRNGLSDQLRAMQEQPRDQGLRPPANNGLIVPGK
jgi:hypothetical protein